MSKIFGKKQMLGLLTAGAIVVTTAGSFAVWDTLSGTASGTVMLDKPITVKAEGGTTYGAGTRTLEAVNTYTASDVKFDVANEDLLTDPKLTLVTTVKIGDKDVSDQFIVEIKKGSETLTGGEDNKVESSNTYSVALTPVESANQDVVNAAVGGTALNVEVTGTLSGTLNTTP